MKRTFQNKEDLEALLQRLSVVEIAGKYGVTTRTVYYSMDKLKITHPRKTGRISKFQSKEELEALLQRLSVEEIAEEHGVTTKTVYFSMHRLGITQSSMRAKTSREKHWHWKGGGFRDGSGYWRVLMPEHPEADTNGYVLEHRLVMEQQILKRRLRPDEQVHHINRVRRDNRPENLRLIFPQAHHGDENECPRCGFKWLTH